MKKILAFMICIVLFCAMPVVVFAEGGEAVDESVSGETIPSPEAEPAPPEQENSITDAIVAWITENFEEISVIVTLVLTVFYQARKHIVLNKSIGTLNNNAVTVSERSNDAINTALTKVQGVADVVNGYKEEIALLLSEIGTNAEEKKKLEQALSEVHEHLKTAKLANIELANEVAELLVLANIPNSKKDELYSRHLAAVGAIAEAEKAEATDAGEKAVEVKEDENQQD